MPQRLNALMLQDAFSLYLGLEHCPNGELYDQIRLRGRLDEAAAQFYAAEVVLMLAHLREHAVVRGLLQNGVNCVLSCRASVPYSRSGAGAERLREHAVVRKPGYSLYCSPACDTTRANMQHSCLRTSAAAPPAARDSAALWSRPTSQSCCICAIYVGPHGSLAPGAPRSEA